MIEPEPGSRITNALANTVIVVWTTAFVLWVLSLL
jgi:hypothetical protein